MGGLTCSRCAERRLTYIGWLDEAQRAMMLDKEPYWRAWENALAQARIEVLRMQKEHKRHEATPDARRGGLMSSGECRTCIDAWNELRRTQNDALGILTDEPDAARKLYDRVVRLANKEWGRIRKEHGYHEATPDEPEKGHHDAP